MGLDPALGLVAIPLCTPNVDDDESEEEGQDVQLQLEVFYGGALPHAVPCRVWALANRTGGRGLVGSIGEGRDGSWLGFRSARIVGEVCDALVDEDKRADGGWDGTKEQL